MNARAPLDPRKLLTWLGLAFGILGLSLQFGLSMSAMLGSGRDILGALGNFFSYYTILTNTVLVLIYLSTIWPADWLELFRHPVLRAMMAANIALVTLFVFFVLRHQYVFTGLLLLADNMLHYVCPLLYLLWWLTAQPHGQLRWGNLPLMLAPTLVYFLYAMARGAWVLEYPYGILDAIKLGYGQVLLNALFMTAGLAVLCLIVIATDSLLGRKGVAVDA
jgi:hypothetical protein